MDLKKLRELAEETLVRHDALQVNLGDPVVIIPSTTVLSLLDTIERYERALEYYCREIHWENSVSGSCGDGCCTYYDGDPAILSDRGARAREALNQKEGV